MEESSRLLCFFSKNMDEKQHEKIFPMILKIFLHGTWGFIQSTAGFFLFLRYIKYPHSFYRGVVRTEWPTNGGISLGMFIFTPPQPAHEKAKSRAFRADEKETEVNYCEEVAVHEFGHTFQKTGFENITEIH